jgi:omega-amidase
MKLAVAQVTCVPADIEINCAKIALFSEKAKEAGCNAIVFPEMMDTGYELRAIRKSASTWNDVPYQTVIRAAKDNGLFVFCGLSEREESHIYNSLVVIGPDGEPAGKYRKTHLFMKDDFHEDQVITPGSSAAIIKIRNMRIGLMICYDLRFPEFARTLALGGADILIVANAWPRERITHFTALARTRAIENQCFVAAANRVGTDGGTTFGGTSSVFDPLGDVLASCDGTEEDLAVAEISLELLRTTRKSMPVFNGRKPELYRI